MNESNDTTKSQTDKFKEAARERETDDDEKAIDEKLKRIAETEPKPNKGKGND